MRCVWVMASIAILLSALVPALGCGTRGTSTVTTRTVEYPPGSTLPDGTIVEEGVVVKERTTTEETQEGSVAGGVVTGAAKLVWTVVTIPFRVLFFVFDLLT